MKLVLDLLGVYSQVTLDAIERDAVERMKHQAYLGHCVLRDFISFVSRSTNGEATPADLKPFFHLASQDTNSEVPRLLEFLVASEHGQAGITSFPEGFRIKFSREFVERILNRVEDHLREKSAKVLSQVRLLLGSLSASISPSKPSDSIRLSHLRELSSRLDASAAPDFIRQVAAKHLFAPGGCRPFEPASRFGKYLGFVDIRLNRETRAPIAMGLLIPPRMFRHDHTWSIITGDYSRLFGATSIESTVYVMHDSASSGTYCAQAAIIMALGFLADRGAQLVGPIDISYLAIAPEMAGAVAPDGGDCSRGRSGAVAAFPAYGLTIMDIARLFRRHSTPVPLAPAVGAMQFQSQSPVPTFSPTGVSADILVFPSKRDYERLWLRLCQAYIHARCPVVLLLDARNLYGGNLPHSMPHAVVLIGVKEIVQDVSGPPGAVLSSPSHFMIHDPGSKPFLVAEIPKVMDAAINYASPTQSEEVKFAGQIHATFVANERIRTHAYDCIRHIRQTHQHVAFRYLFPSAQVLRSRADYSISLSYLADIIEYFRSSELPHSDKVLRVIDSMQSGWYWMISCYANKSGRWALRYLHLYSSELSPADSFLESKAFMFPIAE